MSILSDLINTLKPLNVPIETGVFTDKAPNKYIVLTPIDEYFLLFGDNAPLVDISSVRISLYTKGNYLSLKNSIVKALINDGYTLTNRQYIGYETETMYHHYNIDVENYYETEEF